MHGNDAEHQTPQNNATHRHSGTGGTGERAGFPIDRHWRPPGDVGHYGFSTLSRFHATPTRSTRAPMLSCAAELDWRRSSRP